MKKKLGIWAIAITLFISICGCGRGKGGENVQQTALAKDYVYSVETLELEEWKDGTYSNALKSGERMYVYGYEWNEENCNDYQRHYPEVIGYEVLRPVRKIKN